MWKETRPFFTREILAIIVFDHQANLEVQYTMLMFTCDKLTTECIVYYMYNGTEMLAAR